MTRSPLFYPLNRGMDAEAGGVADLQTDVMRFIAILALCLVAIFALVQSIPLMPVSIPSPPILPSIDTSKNQTEATQAVTPEPVEEVSAPKPVLRSIEPPPPRAIEERPLVITRPAPKRIERRPPPPEIIEQTVAPEVAETLIPRAIPETTAPEPTPAPVSDSQGFTLRFETDTALTRLVARNEVGLYAISPEKSVRMNVNRGALSFWPASVPNQFHEMDETTVPDEVLTALRRAGSVKTADVKWGVTLPTNMRRQLEQYLNESQGGSLIISGDGNLRLEP